MVNLEKAHKQFEKTKQELEQIREAHEKKQEEYHHWLIDYKKAYKKQKKVIGKLIETLDKSAKDLEDIFKKGKQNVK